MDLSLQAKTHGILQRYNLKPRKGLSQNFLVDDQVFFQMIEAARVKPEDRLMEIGAGLGLLTEALAEKAHQVTALEIDERLCEILQKRFSANEKIQVVCQDVLKFNPATHFRKNVSGTVPDGCEKVKLIGNLPYHISGAILRWLLNNRIYFSAMHLTVQKEVAERIVGKPKSKSYGVLSLLCQYFTKPELLFLIPKEAFLPRPKVESAFVKLTPQPDDWAPNPHFVPLVKQSFSQRRKTLYNNLKSWKLIDSAEWGKIFADAGITGRERAEELPLSMFVKISELLDKTRGRAH